MFIIYYILSYILLPFALLRLLFKAKEHKGYIKNVFERLAIYDLPKHNNYIWVHAVSVGETKACISLINSLINKYPDNYIIFTNTTPTGREIAHKIFSSYIAQKKLYIAYLPYDVPYLVKRFYKYFQPKLGIILESEIWPHLIKYSKLANVKLILANARLSPGSYKRMLYFRYYIQKILNYFTYIAAQTQVDYNYYKSLGANHISVMGNLKFDCLPNNDYTKLAQQYLEKKLFNNKKFTTLLASTRDGEEDLLIQSWLKSNKPCNLIVLPRHMHRLKEIEELLLKNKITYILRSDLEKEYSNYANYEVILGNTMGEMPLYIELSDIVVMGGSWLPFGGQNILEPCMQGRCVIVGEHTFNFLEATEKAIIMNAAFRYTHATDVFNNINIILENKNELAKNAIKFVKSYQGATDNLIKIIDEFQPNI